MLAGGTVVLLLVGLRWIALDVQAFAVVTFHGVRSPSTVSRDCSCSARSRKQTGGKKKQAGTESKGTEVLYEGPTVEVPDILDFDLTGGRPGAIIETEEQLKRKDEIFDEIDKGQRQYPSWFADYGTLIEDEEAEYDTDDPDAIDMDTLGTYGIRDLSAKFDFEWNPETDPDPNEIQDTTGFVTEVEKDEDGVEVLYDPIFGSSNPIDERTRIGSIESYMIDENTRDESRLPNQFPNGDLEIDLNADFVKFRKSLDIIETYVDDFLPDLKIPRNVAKWHGYPEQIKYPPKNYTNNRFTKPEDLTNFDEMSPYEARQKAVELARSKNAEWLPDGMSQEWHRRQRQPYVDYGTLVGTLEAGECDPDIVAAIQPALNVLGSCVDLLSIENGTVFRFHYHGLMKNKHGMAAWTETMIRECDVPVTGVVFETGWRRRDRFYDCRDAWNGPDW